jgi:peptidyl-prolyl cis-trans isomerase B (cyclophilin B)
MANARQRLAQAAAVRATQAARRRRRIALGGAAAAAVLLVIGATVWFVSRGDSGTPAAAPSESAQPCDWGVVPVAARSKETKEVGTPPATRPARTGTATMTITTDRGVIKVQMDRSLTPCAVASFEYLASKRFFDNSPCHRLITKQFSALQCGDPAGTGWGGPAYRYLDENLPVDRRPAYPRGVVALANQGPNTNQSQFFIFYADSDLKDDVPVVGRVIEGLSVVEELAKAGDDGRYDKNPDGTSGPGGGLPKQPIKILSLAVT